MSSEQEYQDDLTKYPEPFWQQFVYISPRPDQQDLIDGLRQLCPQIQEAVDGYAVETGYVSEAAWEYLATHDIPYDKAIVPKDVG